MSRPTLVTGAAGFAGSHLLDLLAARGADVVAWHRPGGAPPRRAPASAGRPSTCSTARPCATRFAPLQPAGRLSLRRRRARRQAWDTTDDDAGDQRARHAPSDRGLRDRAPDARVLIPSSALVYAPSTEPLAEDHPLLPASPYGLSKLAQEMVGAGQPDRPARAPSRGRSTISGRARIRRSPRRASRERIADDRGGPMRRRFGRQSRAASRPDRCPRYGARLPADSRARHAGPALQRLLGPGHRSRRSARHDAAAGHACRFGSWSIRRAIGPNDSPVVQGDPTRIRDELGWTAEIPLEQTIDDLLEYWREQSRCGMMRSRLDRARRRDPRSLPRSAVFVTWPQALHMGTADLQPPRSVFQHLAARVDRARADRPSPLPPVRREHLLSRDRHARLFRCDAARGAARGAVLVGCSVAGARSTTCCC